MKPSDELLAEKKAQLRRGLLEFCILLAISEDRAYSSDILKKLKDANLLVVEGTLYPLLSRLRAQDLVAYDWEESPAGPPRKYYKLTGHGQETLKHLQKTWKELHRSIITLEDAK